MTLHRYACAALLAANLGIATASAAVTVEDAWVRATAPGQKVGAAYMKLRSTEDASLVGVKTSVTPRAEVHEMSMQGGVMKMRQIPALALPAAKTVELAPGGHHLMLMNLAQPLKAGERVPLTLVIENAKRERQEIAVQAEVRSAPVATGGHHKH